MNDDDFELINSKIPDLGVALAQRISQNQQTSSPTPTSGKFDPFQVMLKKKESETAPIDPSTIQHWPEEDVKRLQDYCQKMGIIGFNSGRMHPIAALAELKRRFGDDFTDVPLEERLPAGYEKIGASRYGPNYPYSQAMNKKQILHG